MKKVKIKTYIILMLLLVILIGMLLPDKFQMPVSGAKFKSYDQKSYWYYPWGKSVTHKGVDIFAKQGTNISPATSGIVIRCGTNELGGNFVTILSSKWRLHYYAHLKEIKTKKFSFVTHNDIIGTVGATGNAKGKVPHLHYSINTMIPYIWQIDSDRQGWKKMFYINPVELLNQVYETE